jgi:hypothetical protein
MTWGGTRKGAGRPRTVENPRRISVTLGAHDIEWLEAYAEERGHPSLSSALRWLINDAASKQRRGGP